MKRVIQYLLFAGLIVSLVGAARALNYLYLTDQEMTVFGDRIKFWHGDTLGGPVHSNSQIAIMQDPVFNDIVSTTASDFWRGTAYSPYFARPPIFRAPRVPIPNVSQSVRNGATAQGQFYPNDGKTYYLVCDGAVGRMYRWNRGTPFDSSETWDIPIGMNACLFVDAPLWVRGHVQGRLSVGSSQLIRIMDDITTVDADSQGRIPQSSQNLIGLVSEGDIKVANTYANGRHNSELGSDVIISAQLQALGESVTFENQNDPDSGYVCDCVPDDRGMLYVFGNMVQMRRGYFHRSNNQSTGYHLKLRYDERLRHDYAPYFFDQNESSWGTDSLDFGDVVVGTAAWDTARVFTNYYAHLGAVYATNPFHGVRQMPFQGYSFIIPASFTPPREGVFSGILYVTASAEHFSIVIRGRGVPDTSGAAMTLNISPNPFNLMTTIRYSIPEAGDIRFSVYDILGREAKRVDLAEQSEGEHTYSFNASDLASGVYFLTLQTAKQHKTAKLLLVK